MLAHRAGSRIAFEGSTQRKSLLCSVSQREGTLWPSCIPWLLLTQQLQKMGVDVPSASPSPSPCQMLSLLGCSLLLFISQHFSAAVFIPTGNFEAVRSSPCIPALDGSSASHRESWDIGLEFLVVS